MKAVKILLLGSVVLMMTSCSKDSQFPSKDIMNGEQKNASSKLDELGMAMNIKTIDYVSKDTYEMTFHDDLQIYTIAIKNFYIDSLIEFEISDNTNYYESIMNINQGTIEIDSVKYWFDDFEITPLSSATDIMLRITTGVLVSHIFNPEQGIEFQDNGNSDYFPSNPFESKCFWCKRVVQHEYFPGLCYDITTRTIFWLDLPPTTGETYAC